MITVWIAITAIIFSLITSGVKKLIEHNPTEMDSSGSYIALQPVIHAFFLAGIAYIALSLRMHNFMIKAETGDYKSFLYPWYQFILENGGFSALKFGFSNYSPPYLYLLAFSAKFFGLNSGPYLPIKIIPIGFDMLNAFLVYRLIQKKYPKGFAPVFGVFVFLFAPTVLFNSAYWGQADAIYTSGLLACLLFLINEKEFPAFICYGFALAIKLQAIFLLPFLIILLLYRKVSWKSFLLIPGVYFLSILPVLWIGRPLMDVLGIYFKQADTYKRLSLNAPTLYAWVPNSLYEICLPLGLIIAFVIISGLIILIYRQKIEIGKDQLIALAFYSLLITPFLLPKMHERYFYPADVLAIILAFTSPRLFFVPVIMVSVSFFSCFQYLFKTVVINIPTLALILLGLIMYLILRWKSVLNIEHQKQDGIKKIIQIFSGKRSLIKGIGKSTR